MDKCKNSFYHQIRCSMIFHVTLQFRAYVDSEIRMLLTNGGTGFTYLYYYLTFLTRVSVYPSKSTTHSLHYSLPWEDGIDGFPCPLLPVGPASGEVYRSSEGVKSGYLFLCFLPAEVLPLGLHHLSVSSCSVTDSSTGFY